MLSFEVQIFSSCNLESAINKTEKRFSLIGYAKEDIHGKIAEGLVFFEKLLLFLFFLDHSEKKISTYFLQGVSYWNVRF